MPYNPVVAVELSLDANEIVLNLASYMARMMKIAKLQIINMLLCLLCSQSVMADTKPIHHLVVVWLKTDQANAAQIYREASQLLTDLPGVLEYKIASRANIVRPRANPSVDESYDLIVDSQFESASALEAFLQHPDYVRIAQEQLRSLVDHYRVYDFVQ